MSMSAVIVLAHPTKDALTCLVLYPSDKEKNGGISNAVLKVNALFQTSVFPFFGSHIEFFTPLLCNHYILAIVRNFEPPPRPRD